MATGLLAALLAAAAGRVLARLLRGRRRGLSRLQRWARWLAAACVSGFGLAFAAGVAGAMAQGDNNPALPTLGLGTLAAAALLWRGPQRHLGLAGHWLATLWLLWAADRSLRSPLVALLFLASAVPAGFAAAAETVSAA